MSAKKLSKLLRRSDLTSLELNTLIEILIRREEDMGEWEESSGKKLSIVAVMKNDLKDKEEKLRESEELTNGLQVGLNC